MQQAIAEYGELEAFQSLKFAEFIENVQMNCESRSDSLVQIGEKFSKQLELNEIEISHFARMCGDPNPLHHDLEYAKTTRFGQIIVSGPHITSLMMAMTAEHFSYTPMVGLEFSFQFLKAIAARELVNLEWEIVSSQNKPSLNGEIVELKGKITNQNEQILLTGRGKILLTAHL